MFDLNSQKSRNKAEKYLSFLDDSPFLKMSNNFNIFSSFTWAHDIVATLTHNP